MSNKKKTRNEKFYYRTKDNVSQISITYDQSLGGFVLHDADPASVRVEKSYDRESGKEKILGNIFSGSDFATFDIDEILKRQYSYLISIDTNSRTYKNRKVSICTCYAVPGKLKDHGNAIPFNHLVSYLIINPKSTLNPETIGWSLVIKHNLKLPLPNKNERLAIIVDSEKDSLESYNNKEKPYCGDVFLPEQVFLGYASDKEKDNLPGQMIKMCHNVSNQIAQKIFSDNFEIPHLSNSSDLYEGYCVITGKNAQQGN